MPTATNPVIINGQRYAPGTARHSYADGRPDTPVPPAETYAAYQQRMRNQNASHRLLTVGELPNQVGAPTNLWQTTTAYPPEPRHPNAAPIESIAGEFVFNTSTVRLPDGDTPLDESGPTTPTHPLFQFVDPEATGSEVAGNGLPDYRTPGGPADQQWVPGGSVILVQGLPFHLGNVSKGHYTPGWQGLYDLTFKTPVTAGPSDWLTLRQVVDRVNRMVSHGFRNREHPGGSALSALGRPLPLYCAHWMQVYTPGLPHHETHPVGHQGTLNLEWRDPLIALKGTPGVDQWIYRGDDGPPFNWLDLREEWLK
jgi:hypothetical protein